MNVNKSKSKKRNKKEDYPLILQDTLSPIIQEAKFVLGMQLMSEVEPYFLRGRNSSNIFININRQCKSFSEKIYNNFTEDQQKNYGKMLQSIEDFIISTYEE